MIVLNDTRGPEELAVSTLKNISRKAPKIYLCVTEHPNDDTFKQQEKVTAETEY